MRTRIFFYGLYMDTGLLESMGFHPREVGAARLDDYRIRLGQRATLVPARGKSAYGMLLELAGKEASALYSRPEVRGYVPANVQVTLLADSSSRQAVCYVLPAEETGAEANLEYAGKLATLLTRLGLPSGYIREIEALE